MDRHRLALLTALGVLALPGTALAAPVKISPQPSSVTARTATVEVANPTRHVLRGSATAVVRGRSIASRTVRLPKRSVSDVTLRFGQSGVEALSAANGRATIKLALRRAGGKKTTARRTRTLRFASGAGQGPAGSGQP